MTAAPAPPRTADGPLFMGIDPGLSGALAVLNHAGQLVDVIGMPTDPIGKSRRVSGRSIARWINETLLRCDTTFALCMVEQVASRPGQGVASMFSFGRSLGAVEGALGALSMPTDYATPQTWKKAFSLGSDKQESIRKACDLIPALAGRPNPKGPTDGMAEAVLLAEFARRRWSGKQS